MRAILPDLLTIVGPLLVGVVTLYAMEWLTKASTWIDGLSPHMKRGVVMAIAGAITLAANRLGVALPTDLALWEPTTIDALVSAVLAMAAKAGDSAKEAKHANDANDAPTEP
jgi:NhaP-type Na+/H+ or K+/H+ antiporter